MTLRAYILASFLCVQSVLIVGCAGQSSGATPPSVSEQSQAVIAKAADDADIEAKIDSSIVGDDRKTLHHVMSLIPTDNRTNVIFADIDGKTLTNHTSLKKSVQTYFIKNGRYTDSSGMQHHAPAESVKPGERSIAGAERTTMFDTPGATSGGTGAFRRMYSAPGFGWIRARLNIKCSTANMRGSDTPYIYVGGWGNTGGAIDAGFQYSPTYDRMNLFIKKNGGPLQFIDQPFPCGKENVLTFSTTDDPTLVYVNGNGINPSTGYGMSYVIAQRVAREEGWTQTCVGCVMKRMTSIAQAVENLHNGSSFGVYNGSPVVHWYNTTLSTGDSSYPCYNGAYQRVCYSRPFQDASPSNVRGFQSYPAFSNQVLAVGDQYKESYDGIKL